MTLPRHGGDENLPAIRHELISLFSGTSDKILKPQMKRNAVLNVTKTTTVFACNCITIQQQQHFVKKSKELMAMMDYLSQTSFNSVSGK